MKHYKVGHLAEENDEHLMLICCFIVYIVKGSDY